VAEQVEVQWFRTRDNTLSLVINGRANIISPTHPFNAQAIKACVDYKPHKAVAFMRMHHNVLEWSERCPVKKINGVWHIEGRAIDADKATANKIDAIYTSAIDESIVTSVLTSWAAADNDTSKTAAAIRDSPLSSPDSCEISFYGWMEYLRRYGSICVDAVDDFENKRFEVLSESLRSKRRAYTLTVNGHKVLAIEVPVTVTSCEQAKDWLQNNVSGIDADGIAKQLNTIIDPSPNNYFRQQARKITL
jgi:hypothetical protein